MKLILYVKNGYPHHKNYSAIKRMCKNIEYEESSDCERIKIDNYDILMSCNIYIDPTKIPKRITIIMGPQLFIFPEGPIVGSRNEELSERCVLNTLSPWIKDLYKEFGDLIIPMKEFPFGVDIDTFQPYHNTKEYDCIVYSKHRSDHIVHNTINILNEKGLRYKVIKYGSYKEEDYIASLQHSKFMVVLDAHESQGFALQEAMACNVPLVVLDATSMYDESDGINSIYAHLKPKKLLATSVPYWSDECGIKTDEAHVSDAIDIMKEKYEQYTPRDYIIRTLSDEVCMKRILEYVTSF